MYILPLNIFYVIKRQYVCLSVSILSMCQKIVEVRRLKDSKRRNFSERAHSQVDELWEGTGVGETCIPYT